MRRGWLDLRLIHRSGVGDVEGSTFGNDVNLIPHTAIAARINGNATRVYRLLVFARREVGLRINGALRGQVLAPLARSNFADDGGLGGRILLQTIGNLIQNRFGGVIYASVVFLERNFVQFAGSRRWRWLLNVDGCRALRRQTAIVAASGRDIDCAGRSARGIECSCIAIAGHFAR